MREAKYVGVTPDARGGGGLGVVTEGGSYARDLVGRDADAGARPAKKDAFITGFGGHRSGRCLRDFGPGVLSAVGAGAERDRLVGTGGERGTKDGVDGVWFVGGEGDAHSTGYRVGLRVSESR